MVPRGRSATLRAGIEWTDMVSLTDSVKKAIQGSERCPRYEAFRNILRRNHPNLHAHNYSLQPLFDPRNGLPDLIQFMHRSGAFTKSGAPRPDPKPD